MPINRRDFIRTASLAAGATMLPRVSWGATGTDKVLVVVNLNGGNDGLNTLVPVSAAQYDAYRALRPTLAHDLDVLLPLSGAPDYRLNPAMTAFRDLYGQGRLAIITGVGVPDTAPGLFDHSAGQYEFQSCDLSGGGSASAPSGWIGRWLDGVERGQVTPGVDLGGGRLMLTGASSRPIGIRRVSDFRVKVTTFDQTARRAAYTSVTNLPVTEGGVGEQNRLLRLQVLQESDVLLTAAAGYAETVTYPDTGLGLSLRECAKLIWSDVGVRAMAVGLGGFDSHSGQNLNGSGDHDALLADVSNSIAAFHTDIVNLGLSGRTLILTISEFGRRAFENSDAGSDHGLASVCFALGEMVHGGVYGGYPSLTNLILDGNLETTTDFRSVYATALADHLGADPVPILGGSFAPVPYL